MKQLNNLKLKTMKNLAILFGKISVVIMVALTIWLFLSSFVFENSYTFKF